MKKIKIVLLFLILEIISVSLIFSKDIEDKDYGWIGIEVLESDSKEIQNKFGRSGAVVQNVIKDSPSDIAGIREGDLIFKVGHRTISNLIDFYQIMESLKIGEKIKIAILRNKEEKNFSVQAEKGNSEKIIKSIKEKTRSQVDEKIKSILEGMEKKYESLETYQDRGQLDEISKRRGRERKSQINFTNHFKKPNKFRFEWEKLGEFSKHLVISDGKDTFTYWESFDQYRKDENLGHALAGATGVSRRSVATIAEFVLPQDWQYNNIWSLKELKHLGQEEVDGILCDIIQGSLGRGAIDTYWIGVEDKLIRKRKSEKTATKEQAENLRKESEEFLKKYEKEIKKKYKIPDVPKRPAEGWSLTEMEIHKDIKINDTIADDFFIFKPPKGSVLVDRFDIHRNTPPAEEK